MAVASYFFLELPESDSLLGISAVCNFLFIIHLTSKATVPGSGS